MVKPTERDRRAHLDRLAQLHDDDLAAVVNVIESAIIRGDGWLQRTADGRLRARETTKVTIHEGRL